MDTTARSVRLAGAIADAVAGGALRSVGFTVSPSGKKGKALLAETALQRARGLREAPLTSHDAMVFAWPADHTTPMTMHGVNRDLEIAWLDEAGGHLGHMVMPAHATQIAPPGPYRHAMEFEVGGLQEFGLDQPGSRVSIADLPPPSPAPEVDPVGRWGQPDSPEA